MCQPRQQLTFAACYASKACVAVASEIIGAVDARAVDAGVTCTLINVCR